MISEPVPGRRDIYRRCRKGYLNTMSKQYLWEAMQEETPLQIAGAVNAYSALLAQKAGFRALYISGAGVANASYGLPDLGLTSLNDVLEDVRRISGASPLPLLVDADTGWGSAFNIARTVREMEKAGAAGLHIEDQVAAKRCGHRPGTKLVATTEMEDRVKAAADGRTDPKFVVMARTDAAASEGVGGAIDRAVAYVEAGADMIFAEALPDLQSFEAFCSALSVPVLANMTEFGKTPILSAGELGNVGVQLVLYPLSAFRAMCAAAERVYLAIREEQAQESVLSEMQTRETLYEVLGYREYEQKLDQLFAEENDGGK
jgi:methylisocitrate lyase